MVTGFWSGMRKFVLGGVTAALLATSAVQAQAPRDEMAEMRQRLEALERQNQQLMQLINQPRAIEVPVNTATNAVELDKNQVQTIVGDYLKEQEKKKKEEEDKKKKEEEAAGFEVGKDLKMNAVWNHGLWVSSADKAFVVHVGGRTQFDTVWYTAGDELQYGRNGVGAMDDGFEFRRGRLAVEGTLWEVIGFNCEYDFVNTTNILDASNARQTTPIPVPTDLWAEIMHIPILGNLRVGNQKPEISFEHLTSSRYLTFLERSYAFDAFIGGLDNGFRPGVQAYNSIGQDERFHWAVGVFKNQQTVFGFNTGDGEYQVVGRVTGLPVYSNDGRCLVHVGVGAMHQDLDDNFGRFRARTLLRNGPAALHTTFSDVRVVGTRQNMIVPEFALVYGPLSIQAEYYANWVDDAQDFQTPVAQRRVLGTAFHQSAYCEVGYFLTGEHRIYNKRVPGFTRVVPNENYFLVKGDKGMLLGRGAWQVAGRYSWIDLNSLNIGTTRGDLHNFTAGLNWFLNPNLKFQWNYSADIRNVVGDTGDGVAHGLGMRMALDF